MTAQIIPVGTFDLVVFGGTGDLARRKLLPALYYRDLAGQIPDDARIIGVARSELSAEAYRERALEADPTHWKALALAGTAAFNRQDYKQAVAYWEKMKATVPPGSPIAGVSAGPPASSRATEAPPSKSRRATTHPAVPAPTTT